MRLVTDKGELTLPSDFSFEIEQNSAFFSEEGAASITATIPATPQDQSRLGFPARLARKDRFINTMNASIQKGVYQKHGQLVIASSDERTITCTMALEDSDLYTQHKDKNLKEIFSAKVLTDYNTPLAWSEALMKYYQGRDTQQQAAILSDFRLCPVAVNFNEEQGTYQVNNEPNRSSVHNGFWDLLHEHRIVQEGDSRVTVPEGYGLAPFLKLSAFFHRLFELLGYTVGQNCFSSNSALYSLILLHNCSDVVCNARIDYSDLVPNKTVSEILDWMNQKFHAQISVNPEEKVVDILLMEDILQAHSDHDLTPEVLGHLNYAYNGSSRVTITPDTSLDGATAADETVQDIISKYGGWVECDEDEFSRLTNETFVLRLSLGRFYEVKDGIAKLIGTNYFKYDRKNADGAEDFSPEDLVPPMVYVSGVLMPYIGERKHRNTTYKDSDKDQDQDIIIAEYAGSSSSGRYRYATTQKYDDTGAERSGRYNLTAEDMYFKFFQGYGDIILNNKIEVSGKFNLKIEDIFRYNMYALKHMDGQKLLPTFLKYEVGRKIQCLEAKFILVKTFADGISDEPVTPPAPTLVWQFNNSELEEIEAGWPDPGTGLDTWYQFTEDDPYPARLQPPAPQDPPAYRGQQSQHVTRHVDIWQEDLRAGGQSAHIIQSGVTFEQWYDAVAQAG